MKIELTRVKLALRIHSLRGKWVKWVIFTYLGYLLIFLYLGGFLISHQGVFSRSHSSSTWITLTGVEFISTKSTFVISYFKLSYPPSLSGLNWSFFCSGVLWKKISIFKKNEKYMKSKIFDKTNKKGKKRAKVQRVSKRYNPAEWNSRIWYNFLLSNQDIYYQMEISFWQFNIFLKRVWLYSKILVAKIRTKNQLRGRKQTWVFEL